MADDKEERRGFQVRDRRRFSDSGEARPDVAEETAEPPPRPAAAESAAPGAAPADEPVTFSTFVLGLSTQALLHLGEIPNPMTRALERDLGAAKHVIDILRQEFEMAMMLTGRGTMAEIDASVLWGAVPR